MEDTEGRPPAQVADELFVSPVVTNDDVPPCFTFTEIVEVVTPGTGISTLIGVSKLSPTLEIPNSTAPFDDSY